MADLPRIFDRNAIARHLLRRPSGRDDFVTSLVLGDLEHRLSTVTRRLERAVLLSPDASGMPTRGRSAEDVFSFTRFSTALGSEAAPLVPVEPLTLPEHGY